MRPAVENGIRHAIESQARHNDWDLTRDKAIHEICSDEDWTEVLRYKHQIDNAVQLIHALQTAVIDCPVESVQVEDVEHQIDNAVQLIHALQTAVIDNLITSAWPVCSKPPAGSIVDSILKTEPLQAVDAAQMSALDRLKRAEEETRDWGG